ncbi:MAG: glycoside hydrolase family 38 C-terminal domain-containing protein, partial [Gemmatimonadaceae bacterium]
TLVHHLPRSGYEYGSNLPRSAEAMRRWWHAARKGLAGRARLGSVLLLNGADHHAPQPALSEALAALREAARPDIVRLSSLAEFAGTVCSEAGAAEIPLITGELRASYGYTWTLQGTFSSRASQKRANAHAERILVRDAEPWAVLARLAGADSRAHLLHAAWKALLLCHPHDTLCGCSIDEVARAMSVRLDDAVAQAQGIRDDALLDIMGHDAVRAHSRRDQWRSAVLVRNRAARPRAGIAELEVAVVRQRVRVGPGSGENVEPAPSDTASFSLNGGAVPYQLLEVKRRHDRVDSPAHYPDDALVDVARVVAWVPEVAGYGTRCLSVEQTTNGTSPSAAAPLGAAVTCGERWMENEHLRVEIEGETVSLVSREHGFRLPSVLGFEDVGDAGDLYTFSAVAPAIGETRFLGARLAHAGPLRGELHASWEIHVPVSSSRQGRARETHATVLNAALTLDAGSRALRCRVWGENRPRDHRLRVMFGTGIRSPAVHADAAFGPVMRAPVVVSPQAARTERPPATDPLARYVTVSAPDRGVTIYSDGLAEYEAAADGRVAVTLVRAVGELSRNDIPERPGHAGWPVPTPEAQMPGPFEGTFAVVLHGARDVATIDRIERTADDMLLPLTGVTLRSALSVAAPTFGVELRGAGLAFNACKDSEDGEWMVLRCVNLAEHPASGAWTVPGAREARRSRLDETPGDPLPVEERSNGRVEVRFDAVPRAVVTILVR